MHPLCNVSITLNLFKTTFPDFYYFQPEIIQLNHSLRKRATGSDVHYNLQHQATLSLKQKQAPDETNL